MDPNETLRRIRALVALITGGQWGGELAPARELAELVGTLDGWLGKGGFLPEAWARHAGPAVIMTEFGTIETVDGASEVVMICESCGSLVGTLHQDEHRASHAS